MKKAQVTLFVILGIILLLIVIGGFLVYRSMQPGNAGILNIKEDQNLQPVRSYVESCLYSVTKQGLILAGEHGGYVEPKRFSIKTNSLAPTEANSVSLIDDSEPVAYWFYLKSSNECTENCVVADQQPPLTGTDVDSIESQLAYYINENIGACINNMSVFENNNIKLVSIGLPKSQVYIKDDTVDATLSQDIKAEYQSKQTLMNSFGASIPVKFKRAYLLASSILGFEQDPEVRFFDQKTIQMIQAYGLGDNPEIPPINGGVEIGTSHLSWQLNSVNQKLRSILEDHSSVFSVEKTRNSYIVLTQDNTFNGMYNDFSLPYPATLSSPQDFSASFIYLKDWPIYLSINPRKGNTITGENTKLMLLLPITTNEFYYDLSYPMVGLIRDETAFDGEGLNFQFAFEVNIRNNQPLNISGTTQSLEQNQASLFCDPSQKKTDNINIVIKDSENNPVAGASVMFECGVEACYLGETDDSGSITDKLPLCLDGQIKVSQDDYSIMPHGITTTPAQAAQITLPAEKFKEVELVVKKMPLQKTITPLAQIEWVLNPAILSNLDPDDTAEVILEKQSGPTEDTVAESAEIKGTEIGVAKKIRLVPGNYNLEAYVVRALGNDSIAKKDLNLYDNDGNRIESPAVLTIGSYNLDSDNSLSIRVTSDDIAKGKLTLIIPSITIEDLANPNDLVTYTEAMQNLPTTQGTVLQPIFG